MATERILITVKTYPTLSSKYGELVCTAGLREDGSWIRIYPIPFRSLEEYKRFEKWRFITVNVHRNARDSRPESHKIDITTLQLAEDRLDTKDCWRERRRWVLGAGEVHTNLTRLIELANRENSLSLATFKPARMLDFVVEADEREWSPDKVAAISQASLQEEMFPEFRPEKLTKLVEKLPFKFSYLIEDDEGRKSKMMIEDWEIGALYWNTLKSYGDESSALEKVREQYWDNFIKKDLHLFLGTTREWHGRGKNPFVIIGVFYPDHQLQQELDLFG